MERERGAMTEGRMEAQSGRGRSRVRRMQRKMKKKRGDARIWRGKRQ